MTFNNSDEDTAFYSRIQQTLVYHQGLLRDELRNKLFYESLKSRVTGETKVLDIGAGSGVWAIAAARLGAKKVTAIESDEVMIPLIQAHIFENGFAGKVEIVHGNSQSINLAEKYDVIISETIGNQAFDENIVGTMIDARKRFLADDGVIIPQKITLVAAPVRLAEDVDLPKGLPFQTDCLRNLTRNFTLNLTDKNALEMLGESCKMLEIDLREIAAEPDFTNLSAKWNLPDVSRANAVVLWAQAELADGINLDSMKTESWLPVVLRFKPFALKTGEIELNLNANPTNYQWTLRAADEPPQTYSPYFTFERLKIG